MHSAIIIERLVYRVLDTAWRYRKIIMWPMLIMPVVALVIGLLMPIKYKMSLSLLLQEPARVNPFLGDLSVPTNLKERMGSLRTLLHSHHMLVNVLKDMKAIDETMPEREIMDRVDALSGALSVELAGDDLVIIEMRHTEAQAIYPTLEAVANRFVETALTPAWSSLNSSERFLQKELEEGKKRLREVEGKLADFKSQHAQELPMLHTGNVAHLAKIKSDLAEKRSELSGAKGAIGSMEQRLQQSNPVISNIEEQIIAYRSELALLKARYTDKHSKVKAAARSLRRLEAERAKLLAAPTPASDIQSSMPTLYVTVDDTKSQPLLMSQMEQMEMARTRVTQLEQEIGVLEESEVQLQEKVQNFGGVERELLQLQQDATLQREMYQELLRRAEMAKLKGALSKFEVPERIKVIDRPLKTPSRMTPPLMLFIIGGIIGGLAIGVAAATIREAADTTIRYSYQLAAITAVPVLMDIGKQDGLLDGLDASPKQSNKILRHIKGGAAWLKRKATR